MASGGDDRRRKRLDYNSIKEQTNEEENSEFVDVPKDMKGHVIGKGGYMLQEIMKETGARIFSESRDEEGFTVIGDEEQRACARRLILKKVKDVQSTKWERIDIEEKYKGLVIGKHRAKLREISDRTGANVSCKGDDVYIILGNEEQRMHAKVQIGVIVSGGRIRGMEDEFNKTCCFIDGSSFQDGKVKLKQVLQKDYKGLPAKHLQYRLKPVIEDYKPQESCSSDNCSKYQFQLMKDVLLTLRKIKNEMGTKHPKADMWCHFGTAIITVPGKEKVDARDWSIDEATEKFQWSNRENYWKLSFKEGVQLSESIFEGNYKEEIPEDPAYIARYDLTFLTPCWHQLRCKVWVANTNVGKGLYDIPIPLSDIKNILEEIQFEDEATRTRCRGWLVLKSRKYLQADILFPGCEFDCRFTIRGRTDSPQATDAVPEQEVINVLLTYLSELTLREEGSFGLCLPDKKMPNGFHLIHKRWSKRTLYRSDPGFAIILSKEHTWNTVMGGEESRESTDVHLHCKEWDSLLSSGVWEPDVILETLPEFIKFLKEVQAFLFREMNKTVLTTRVPPEILARGPSALEAYNKALADGKTSFRRVPIMFIGQEGAGKTSLKKSLKGICFDQDEESTVGIDADPSYVKVTTETWITGTTDNDQTSEETFVNHAARYIVNSLSKEKRSTELKIESDVDEDDSDSEVLEMPREESTTEPAVGVRHIEASSEPAPNPSEEATPVSPDATESKQEGVDRFAPNVPEEVAAVTETLLQGDWEKNGEDVYSTLWDFAGQSVYYVTHPLFLTARAIYCLVYDLSLNPHDTAKPLVKHGVFETFEESLNLKTNLDYLDFWMTSIAALASSQTYDNEAGLQSEVFPENRPPVFLVCTHADTPYGCGNPKELSRKIFGCLKGRPYGDQLFDVFFVDNTSLKVQKSECPEVLRLRKEVLAVAKDLPHINEVIPIKWLKFEKALHALKEKEHKYISLATAKHIASTECNINQEKEFETLINYLHDLRSLIHFDDTPELSELVVLDPQWLIDVFKNVITVKPYDSGEKRFVDLWCKLEREGVLDERLLAHMWGTLYNNRKTYESLIGIMEKFCLLCPWPSESPTNKSYLVPSMLKSLPPKKIMDLVASSNIPSLFIKFGTGFVPPGFFPRFVLQFFQWVKGNFSKQCKPQFFHHFARFFTSEHEDCSVIFVCHTSSVEVVVHTGTPSLQLAEDFSSNMTLEKHIQFNSPGSTCARAVHRQLSLMLECMRNEFHWLRNMKYEMSFLCPVCCHGGAIDNCPSHNVQGCKDEHCLHFWSESELCSVKQTIICTNSASAQNTKVHVSQFAHWFVPAEQQLATDKQDERLLPVAGNGEKALAIPDDVLESLKSSCDPKDIVCKLNESLQLNEAAMEQPDAETKRLIRYLVRQAKSSRRLDVVRHLRKILPAGTTGPLLPEDLDIREIPFRQGRKLTIALCGGEEWKLVADNLGLNSDEIRFLDNRTRNPADAVLSYIANGRYLSVGELYDVLNDCDLSVLADKL